MIDDELLKILCCPDTKQDVSLATEEIIKKINDLIEKKEVKNKGGKILEEKIDGGLLREDKKILYPIKEDIPIMLIEEGILTENII